MTPTFLNKDYKLRFNYLLLRYYESGRKIKIFYFFKIEVALDFLRFRFDPIFLKNAK